MLRLIPQRATAQTTAQAITSAINDGLRTLTPYPTPTIANDPGMIREAVFLVAATARAVLLTDRTTTDPITTHAHRLLCDHLAARLGPFQPPGPIFEHLTRYDAILEPYLSSPSVPLFDDLISQYLAFAADDYTIPPPLYSPHDTPALRHWIDTAITTTHTAATSRLAKLRP